MLIGPNHLQTVLFSQKYSQSRLSINGTDYNLSGHLQLLQNTITYLHRFVFIFITFYYIILYNLHLAKKKKCQETFNVDIVPYYIGNTLPCESNLGVKTDKGLLRLGK